VKTNSFISDKTGRLLARGRRLYETSSNANHAEDVI